MMPNGMGSGNRHSDQLPSGHLVNFQAPSAELMSGFDNRPELYNGPAITPTRSFRKASILVHVDRPLVHRH